MPDFSINAKAQNLIKNTKSQTQLRASATLSYLIDGNIRIGENDVLEILDKVQDVETTTEYGK